MTAQALSPGGTTPRIPPRARGLQPPGTPWGVLAGVVFSSSVLIQGVTRHGFRIAHDDASLLSNGSLGWIQVATFVMTGLMTVAAAAGMRRALPMRSGASRWAPRLVALFGVAFAGVTSGSSSSTIVVPFYLAVLAAFGWIAIVSIHLYRNTTHAREI